MWKTALLLLVTIIVIPILAFTFDEPLNTVQKTVLTKLAIIYVCTALLCFLVSTLSRNYSQVDKLWSIMPIVYTWVIAFDSGFELRLVLMAAVVSLWGIRLSYNFARRGGYSWKFWSGEEDYRWPLLKSRSELNNRWRWALFNLFFISLYQMGLILLFTLPALKSMEGRSISWVDLMLSGLIIGLVILETIADQQQWNYHKQKKSLIGQTGELPEKYKKGFVDSGLWSLVRHPNYAAEQTIWIVFYFFSVSATGIWLNWSVIGAILLVLLFWGSSNFSESISSGKYPEYADYKKRVPRFIPFIK